MKIKVLVLGSNGVVGHMVASYFYEAGHAVQSCCEYDTDSLKRVISYFQPDAVINCAAIVNQAAEDDKAGAAYMNSYLPHLLEAITAGTPTVVVHRSTDCIFSGARGQYALDDWPDARSFYARTKAVGELNNGKDITIRVSLIGPSTDEQDGSLLNWFLCQKGTVNGFANAIWTGLTTLEYAKTIECLLSQRAHGVFQAAPAESISKYDLLRLFEHYFPGDRTIIRVENSRVDKSLVPFWGTYDIHIPGYEDQIVEMKAWIENHPDVYPPYYYNQN